MADHADVRSLQSLETHLTQTIQYRGQMLKEIENLQLELRRLTSWIENDAQQYWRDQATLAQRQFTEAQETLSRCMSYVREDERQPCTEEKKRFKRAKERRELCEQKLRTVNAAIMAWQRELTLSHSKVQRCRDMAESELTVAIAHLSGQIEQLQQYTNLQSGALRAFAQESQPISGLDQAPAPQESDSRSTHEEKT